METARTPLSTSPAGTVQLERCISKPGSQSPPTVSSGVVPASQPSKQSFGKLSGHSAGVSKPKQSKSRNGKNFHSLNTMPIYKNTEQRSWWIYVGRQE